MCASAARPAPGRRGHWRGRRARSCHACTRVPAAVCAYVRQSYRRDVSRYFHACISDCAARELLLFRESSPAPCPSCVEQRRAVNPLCSRGCVLLQSRALRSITGADHIDLIAVFAYCHPFHRGGGCGWVFSVLLFVFSTDRKKCKWQRAKTISVVSEWRGG